MLAPIQRVWIDLIMARLVKNTVKKSMLDNFVFGSIMNTSYVGMNMLLSGEIERSQILPKMKLEQPAIVLSGWCYWIPVQLVNYRVVPLRYQMNVAQIMALFWHSFLSWKAHNNLKR